MASCDEWSSRSRSVISWLTSVEFMCGCLWWEGSDNCGDLASKGGSSSHGPYSDLEVSRFGVRQAVETQVYISIRVFALFPLHPVPWSFPLWLVLGCCPRLASWQEVPLDKHLLCHRNVFGLSLAHMFSPSVKFSVEFIASSINTENTSQAKGSK